MEINHTVTIVTLYVIYFMLFFFFILKFFENKLIEIENM